MTREFRENLEWAVLVHGDVEISQAVRQLLDELASLRAQMAAAALNGVVDAA